MNTMFDAWAVFRQWYAVSRYGVRSLAVLLTNVPLQSIFEPFRIMQTALRAC